MLDVYAALQSRADVSRYTRIVPVNTPLPPEAHTTAVYDMSTPYQYVVRYSNPLQAQPGFVTVISDVPLSQNNILAKAQTLFTGPGESGGHGEDFDAEAIAIVEANTTEPQTIP
jgi:hypothetical protein